MRSAVVLAVLAGFLIPVAAVVAQDKKPLTTEQAQKLKNPIPYSKKSISQGRNVYMRYCVGCHGADGKATVDVVADATDLTTPKTWKSGTTDGEIFRSIRDGQSASMPAFGPQIKGDDDLWHMVNFIRFLWPEATRPALQADPK